MDEHKRQMKLTMEPPLDPDLPICDSHHHLWIHENETYLLKEFLQDISGGHKILQTICVEAWVFHHLRNIDGTNPVDETEFVASECNNQSSHTNVSAGIVGFADLREGDRVPLVLEKHIEVGQNRFCGIRQSCPWDPHPEITMKEPSGDLLKDPEFRRGFAYLQEFDLTFDIWIYYHQLMDLVDLAQCFPETSIILNHFGTPIGFGPYAGKREQVRNEWERSMGALADCPNMHIKLGGAGMYVNGFDWHEREVQPDSVEIAEAITPYYEFCIEKFGVERCMFESNFPVEKSACSYNALWNAFKRMTRNYSPGERRALFQETAVKVYKLDKIKN